MTLSELEKKIRAKKRKNLIKMTNSEFKYCLQLLKEKDPSISISKIITGRNLSKKMHLKLIEFIFENKLEDAIFMYVDSFPLILAMKKFDVDCFDKFYSMLHKNQDIFINIINDITVNYLPSNSGSTLHSISHGFRMYGKVRTSLDIEPLTLFPIYGSYEKGFSERLVYWMNKFELSEAFIKNMLEESGCENFYYKNYNNAIVVNKYIEKYFNNFKGLNPDDFVLKENFQK